MESKEKTLTDIALDNIREEYEKTKRELEMAEKMRDIKIMKEKIRQIRNMNECDNFTL